MSIRHDSRQHTQSRGTEQSYFSLDKGQWFHWVYVTLSTLLLLKLCVLYGIVIHSTTVKFQIFRPNKSKEKMYALTPSKIQ